MLSASTFHGARRGFLATAVLTFAVSLLTFVASVTPAAEASVQRGVVEPSLPRFNAGTQSEILTQIGPTQLKATWVRFMVSWASAEPDQPGKYDEAFLAGIDSAVDQAQANGLKVMVTFTAVPKWASDSYYWTHNPYAAKGYNGNFAMKTDAPTLAAFRAFCAMIAQRYQGKVAAYECWNEPNLHLFLYPQATSKDPLRGARVYVQMLKQFSAGIRAGDRNALRVGGGTAPRGNAASASLSLRRMMTSPQRFAKAISPTVVKYCDAYSHHPYTPGASKNNWPEAAPRDPSTTVNLRNLGALLKLFPPGMPFYLTEYGYQTAACASFSGQYVSLSNQADYLRRAFKYVARYKQVKALMWYLLTDQDREYYGFYTGLRKGDLTKKPSWYAFAGGNHLSLYAPTSVGYRQSARLYGTLTSDVAGPIAMQSVQVEARRPGGKWSTLKKTRTDATGRYTFSITPSRTMYYRVTWSGVITSRSRLLAVR